MHKVMGHKMTNFKYAQDVHPVAIQKSTNHLRDILYACKAEPKVVALKLYADGVAVIGADGQHAEVRIFSFVSFT
jgi:hypothetical protein